MKNGISVLILSIIGIAVGILFFYGQYIKYQTKKNGHQVEVLITKVTSSKGSGKKHYVGFEFENKKRRISVSNSIFENSVVGNKMILIYNSKSDSFIHPTETPEYFLLFAILIIILSTASLFKGISFLRR